MLPPDCMQKEYEQIVRTPFVFAVGKTCFMEGTPSGTLFYLILSLKCRYYVLHVRIRVVESVNVNGQAAGYNGNEHSAGGLDPSGYVNERGSDVIAPILEVEHALLCEPCT